MKLLNFDMQPWQPAEQAACTMPVQYDFNASLDVRNALCGQFTWDCSPTLINAFNFISSLFEYSTTRAYSAICFSTANTPRYPGGPSHRQTMQLAMANP